jgi:hypothetical protein
VIKNIKKLSFDKNQDKGQSKVIKLKKVQMQDVSNTKLPKASLSLRTVKEERSTIDSERKPPLQLSTF